MQIGDIVRIKTPVDFLPSGWDLEMLEYVGKMGELIDILDFGEEGDAYIVQFIGESWVYSKDDLELV